MSDPIVRLSAADADEALDFLNLVFSGYSPTDFEALLPAVYRRTDEAMGCNWAIREGGRIRAVVGMFPIEWRPGSAVITVAGIGGVSTHPRGRGGGAMTRLMGHCTGLMREQGYALSWLGGQRQRYQHFGYERCGVGLSFTLNRANLKHCFTDEPGLRLVPIEASDAELLGAAVRLHDEQRARCRRPAERFHDHLRGWRNVPRAALDAAGRCVGYLVASAKTDRITEVVADSEEIALRMLRSCAAERAEGGLTVELPAWRTELVRSLGACCESVGVHAPGNFRVFDWEAVVRALFDLRGADAPLPRGAVALGIAGWGTLELESDGARGSARRGRRTPDVELDPLTAMRVLFGPLAPSRVVALPARAGILEQWCPLPLCLPRQDAV